MVGSRINCIECGAELWGPMEACGLCLFCQREEQDEIDGRHDTDDPVHGYPFELEDPCEDGQDGGR
jgi:hypothetical protein